ncbi:hypothetical protein HYPSUDRAFT_46594 [Hypholoma sublateritium FD-334 SS-4]|uniref:Uncharacterized protein n=1 Tax=Hypholoma sublateritium (strain FD-334 SS-4) TaxID=945553 RepID=A0A0D2KRK8_HYPSF|nr:hypothetical protein HYPSUDRAFT_46594 [Hypholoma sublateritium FD-334 SS-4]
MRTVITNQLHRKGKALTEAELCIRGLTPLIPITLHKSVEPEFIGIHRTYPTEIDVTPTKEDSHARVNIRGMYS